MTRYLVEEVVTPGYSIDRGVYDNPKDAQYRAMEIFVNEGIIDAFDELNVYKEVHEKWGVRL